MSIEVSDKIKKYKVSILSESYFLVSDEPEELIKSAVDLVDNCLRQTLKKCPDIELRRLAVLVALQLANKTLKSQDVATIYEHHCDKLIGLIDTVDTINISDTIEKPHCRI